MESVLFDRWHWTRSDVDSLPYEEVYQLFEEATRLRGSDLMWQIRVATFAKSKRRGQQDTLNQIKRMVGFRLSPGRSIYEQVSPDDRAMLIGNAVSVAGEDWLKSHPGQARWLQERGLSISECVRRSNEHIARAEAFSGFVPIRNRRS